MNKIIRIKILTNVCDLKIIIQGRILYIYILFAQYNNSKFLVIIFNLLRNNIRINYFIIKIYIIK